MTLSKTPTRAEALASLASLLEGAPDASGAPISISSLIRPTWTPTHLTIVQRDRACLHCGSHYRDISPSILFTETHRNGSTRSTALPSDMGLVNLDTISTEVRIIREKPTRFCISCIPNLSKTDLYQYLLDQQREAEQAKRGARAERKAQANSRNFAPSDTLAPEWEEINDPAPDLSDLFSPTDSTEPEELA